MGSEPFYDSGLTRADHIVLKNLENDIIKRREAHSEQSKADNDRHHVSAEAQAEPQDEKDSIEATKDIALLESLRNPNDAHFESTIFVSIDDLPNRLPKSVNNQCYSHSFAGLEKQPDMSRMW
ncbi:hypothetical protein TGAM01_v211014 [Trichoderma gamsii]|uniref:Uncharacterized protein n=1 Tax=Trichoderma gamsii TaxID=398673 RepID=A0A2P4Z762_9HYPO|nr:hypothetical protein TGAM01_v211014 [Trichoderma gamsii]PON20119.1 hypothetical protein TGAM01_v211014 [Trichoderma gamsii]